MKRQVDSFVPDILSGDLLLAPAYNFCRDISRWKSEITSLQADLLHLSAHAAQADVSWSDRSAQISGALSALKNMTNGVSMMLNGAVSVGHEIAISPAGCEMVVLLCYVEEQINVLQLLLAGQNAMQRAKSRQLMKIRQEVNSAISALTRGVEIISQHLKYMTVLCDQKRFYERNPNGDVWDASEQPTSPGR